MKKDRKAYARYPFVRGHQALWKGDPAKLGSQFRQVVITSNDFNSTQAMFQVYALENTGKGIENGRIATSKDNLRVLIDEDFQGADAAGEKFQQFVNEAIKSGFKPVTLADQMEFQGP